MAEEETYGFGAGKKLGDDDFYKNENKESLPAHVSQVSPSVSQKNQSSTINKGKSCKGCLYYSTAIKSNSGNPRCVGITGSLPIGSKAWKKDKTLKDFKYGCIGYSVYPDWKDRSSDIHDNSNTELPVCLGFQILSGRRLVTTDSASSQPRNKEDGTLTPAPTSGTRKPAHSFGSEFLTRFRRNAGLVAMGVGKNLKRVGNQIKESVGDIIYPYRRPPK